MQIVAGSAQEFDSFWDGLCTDVDVSRPLYQKANVEYYKVYEGAPQYVDVSFVVAEQRQALVGLKMALSYDDKGTCRMSCFGLPILCVENYGVDSAWKRKARRLVTAELDRLLKEYPISGVLYRDFLEHGQLSFLSHYLLQKEGTGQPEFARVIDLTQAEVDLHRQLPKSNRNQIKWGQDHLAIDVIDHATVTPANLEAFRSLHVRAAGRETRSKNTWDRQYDMVRAGEAFLVLGRLEGNLVTAALFSHSWSHCYYGVSASERALFDKPISHAIVWRAVLHARGLGCRFFEVGDVVYPRQGVPAPSEKELGISVFKRGFGGVTTARMRVEWQAS